MKVCITTHTFCHSLWGRYALPFIFIALSTIFLIPGYAQIDTVNVSTDIPPGEGNLNAAICKATDAGTLSRTVFQLEANGYYILTGTIIVPSGEQLTIIAAEPGQTQEAAPPQILWSASGAMDTKYNFNCYGDITLKNVWLYYVNTNGWQSQSSLQIQDNPAANASGKGEIGIFEGVIFDYAACPQNASGAVGVTAKHFKGIFKNCYFRNCIDPHFSYYGRAVSFPFDESGWHIDSLLFEHCTFANIGYVYMQERGNYGEHVHFNHCTFLNVVMFTLESGWWYKMSVTNSIWVNGFMLGHLPIMFGEGELNGGTIRIDSVANFGFDVPFTDQDRRILFAHNSYYIENWLRDWMYDNPYSQAKRRYGEEDLIPVPQPMLSPATIAFFESNDFPYMNMANLYDETDPEFERAPTNIESIKTFLYYKWDTQLDTNWAYFPEVSAQRLWPLREKLAYTNNTLLTAAMAGFPLGDLYHWFPEDYERWKAQENAEHARISYWLNTGSDSVFTTLDKQADIDVPTRFKLSQNYPNPFNLTTQIAYSVPKYSYLSLKVYNQLGQKVITLFEGYRQTGNYEATFDGSGLPGGVYFYRLTASYLSAGSGQNQVEVRKFLLLK